jgi:hypothetical protein
LIDGLVHKEDACREIAINDLRRITGEYFGYHHDLPARSASSPLTAGELVARDRHAPLRAARRRTPPARRQSCQRVASISGTPGAGSLDVGGRRRRTADWKISLCGFITPPLHGGCAYGA